MEDESIETILEGEFDLDFPAFKKWNPDLRAKKARRDWFALSNNWYQDPKIEQCSDFAKQVWLVLLSLRASCGGPLSGIRVQWVNSRIGFRGGSATSRALVKLAELQLIDLQKSRLTRRTRRDETRRDETESRIEVEETSTPDPSVPNIQEIWNSNCRHLPQCAAVNKNRLAKWKARWREKPQLEYWQETIQRLASSEFASGGNDRTWVATVDFLLKSDTHIKINEGKYDNRTSAKRPLNADLAARVERGEL